MTPERGGPPKVGSEQHLHLEYGGVLSPGGRHADCRKQPTLSLGQARKEPGEWEGKQVRTQDRLQAGECLSRKPGRILSEPGGWVIWAPAFVVVGSGDGNQDRETGRFLRAPGPAMMMAVYCRPFGYLNTCNSSSYLNTCDSPLVT